ncbi:YdcF family protein [Neobacillus notoginsengisoli]|uniref:YdcF family protein n=1 Tax=Neobacillus notoginsengisoli TaxID=1578198 RepID=A0A417YXW9_9BACI|nr:YdcF family protein [Neobacillus notoginsengisoli]RHW42330.1 YdcF family protein [Neobacillus notoginsengisoli]
MKKGLLLAGIAGILYIGFLHIKIIQHSKEVHSKDTEYLIVLGARVKGYVPSLALQARIEAAADYLRNNPKAIAIASGGQGPGENITEAIAIKEGLERLGVEGNRIILEDKSTSTYENISFSKKLIPKGLKKGLIVTNDFHVYRAKMIAKKYGLDLGGLPAETPRMAIVKSYAREYLAITKFYLTSVL